MKEAEHSTGCETLNQQPIQRKREILVTFLIFTTFVLDLKEIQI